MIVPPFQQSAGRDELREKGVPDALRTELLPLWEVRLQVPEAPCLWFDALTLCCRHYDLRPDACRDFEINSPACRASREKWGVAEPV